MHSPEVSDGPRLQARYAKLQPTEDTVHTLYARWAELEAKQRRRGACVTECHRARSVRVVNKGLLHGLSSACPLG
jgi:hypothetical protein